MSVFSKFGNPRVIAAGSTLAMAESQHDGKTILLDTTTGSVVTLPPSTGNGAEYRFVVSVLATSNSHIVKVQNATDVMSGIVFVATTSSDNAEVFQTSATSDTITLNRTTTGSVIIGEFIHIVDIKAGTFAVRGFTSATGTEATPFSAAVS